MPSPPQLDPVDRPGSDLPDQTADEPQLGLAQLVFELGLDPENPRQAALLKHLAHRRGRQ